MKVARNKLTTIIVSIMLIISLFATNVATVFAADGMASTVSTSLIYAERCEYDYAEGQVMSYTVNYSGEAFGSFQLTISGLNDLRNVEIDKNFEYSNQNDMFMSEFDKENGILTANFSSAYSQNTYGSLFTVYFTVDQPEYNIELYPNLDYVAFYDEEANVIPVSSKLGEIIISVNAENPDNQVKGDVDGDQMVTLQDLLIIQRSLLGNSSLNDTQYYLADVNSDGMVDIRDCQYIQKYLVGIIGSFDEIGGNGGGDENKMYYLSIEVYDTNHNYIMSTGLSISDDESILNTLIVFAKRNGFAPVAAYYDYDMTDAIGDEDCAGSDMTVFAVVEATGGDVGDQDYYYIDVMGMVKFFGGEYMPMDGSYGLRVYEGDNLVQIANDEIADYYEILGIYYDVAMTQEVSESDVYSEGISKIYVKLATKEIAGTYDVYNMRVSMDGKAYYDLVGSTELFANGSASLTMGSEIRTASYASIGGIIVMDLGAYEQYQLTLKDVNEDNVYDVIIVGYYNGSDNKESDEYQAIAGGYSVNMQGIYLDLVLMSNGMFEMGAENFYVKGGYQITEEGIILTVMGESMPFIYDAENNIFTPDYNGGNTETPNPDQGELYNLEYWIYMQQPNGGAIPMRSTASEGGIAGANLYSGALSFYKGISEEYSLVGIYYDSAFTVAVGTEDLLCEDTIIYILVETSFAGSYNVLSMEYSEDGTTTTEVIGKIELTDDGSAKGQINATMIEGTYGCLGGQMFLVNVSEFAQYMLMKNESDLMLYSFFDGSDYPEQEELVKWAGDYVVLEEYEENGEITYEEYNMTLYSNGVYNLSSRGVTFIGAYAFEGNVILLEQMGQTEKAEYNEERGCFIAIVEREENVEQVIAYKYVDGDVIYTVEITDGAINIYDNMYNKYACQNIEETEEGIIAYYSDTEAFIIIFDANKEYITYMEKVSTSNNDNSGIIDSGVVKNESLI